MIIFSLNRKQGMVKSLEKVGSYLRRKIRVGFRKLGVIHIEAIVERKM